MPKGKGILDKPVTRPQPSRSAGGKGKKGYTRSSRGNVMSVTLSAMDKKKGEKGPLKKIVKVRKGQEKAFAVRQTARGLKAMRRGRKRKKK